MEEWNYSVIINLTLVRMLLTPFYIRIELIYVMINNKLRDLPSIQQIITTLYINDEYIF